MLSKIDRYEIKGIIGRGSMGIVYEGHDPRLDRKIAVKVLRTDIGDFDDIDEFILRFKREARTAASLSHPNIVTIHDLGENSKSNIMYIIMELVQGKTLKELLGRLDKKRTLNILLQIAEAIDYAHKHNIVHRDIKPANILIKKKDLVKITDFGIAKIIGSDYTQTGRAIGTPSFMSPEQFTAKDISTKSDIFSFGVLAFLLLFNKKPFEGDTIDSIAYKIIYEEPVFPDIIGGSNTKLKSVLKKCLKKDPSERYNNAFDFVSHLSRALTAKTNEEIILEKILTEEETQQELAIPTGHTQAPSNISTSSGVKTTTYTSGQNMMKDIISEFNTGDIVSNYYKIISRIGCNNVETVYLAENITLGNYFVVKKILPNLIFDPEFIEVFKKETKEYSRINHPNIARIVHFDTDTLSVIQEFVDGKTIYELLKIKHIFEVKEAVDIISSILKGLEYVHRHNIVHREIKPSNIMIDMDGNTKITGFGIALIRAEGGRSRSGLGLAVPEYMSPEQIKRDKVIDHRTDIYSLGLLSYEMLTGKHPVYQSDIESLSDFEIMERQVKFKPKELNKVNNKIDRDLSDIIMKALEKDPADRYATCSEFLCELMKIV